MKMFSHRYRYIFILLLSLYTYASTVLCRVYYYFGIEIEWYYALLTITGITIATWEVNHLLEYLSRKKLADQSNKLKALIVFFIAGSFLTTVITILVVFFMSMVIHDHTISETIVPVKLNLIYAWLANLLFHLLNAIVYYLTQYKSKMLEAETFKRLSSQAELQAVKNQVNPHFLFNNLNVLSSLILQNNAEANRFIEAFSQLYRYILKSNDKELVTLEDEIHYIDPYLFLLQKRFNQGLEVGFKIEEAKKQLLIVPASLQMLIENAIKHNIVSSKKPLRIEVYSNGNNTLVISNNLQPRQTNEHSTGIGLRNITTRYKLVSNKEVLVKKDDISFSVTIPLITVNRIP